jgi:hypothetical protein
VPAVTWSQPNRECLGLAPMWTGDNVPDIPATGATAGAPGAFTPAGCVTPANVAAVQSGGITASPATLWTVGQYVQTATAGVTGQCYWTGSAWGSGKAPAAGG